MKALGKDGPDDPVSSGGRLRTPHTANDFCVRTIPAVAFIDKLTDEMMDGCGLGR